MQKPVEPRLEDYGLIPADLGALPSPGRIAKIVAIAIGVSLWLYWIDGLSQKDSSLVLLLFLGLFVFVPGAGVAGGIAYGLTSSIATRFYKTTNPLFASYSAFQQAKSVYAKETKAYELWVARQHEAFWRSMSGVDFEVELGKLFSALGFAVQQTPRTGDGGVDLLLRKAGRLTVVQCKAHQKKIPIGTVRELAASMRDFHADAAIIACLEGVTKPVQEYIKNKSISVLTVHQIVQMQRSLEHN